MTKEVIDRRGFLGKAVGVLAASTAAVVPIQLAQAKQLNEDDMARALYEAVSQFNDENCPSHVQVCNDGRSLNLAMEVLRESSVEEIEQLLSPLFGWPM